MAWKDKCEILDDLRAPNNYVVPPSDDDTSYVIHFRKTCKRYNIDFAKVDVNERDFVILKAEKSFRKKA